MSIFLETGRSGKVLYLHMHAGYGINLRATYPRITCDWCGSKYHCLLLLPIPMQYNSAPLVSFCDLEEKQTRCIDINTDSALI